MKLIDPSFLNPSISVYSNYPTCKVLIPIRRRDNEIDVEGRRCPNCGIEIYKEEIVENLLKNVFVTQAISSANKIVSFDFAVFCFLTVSILTFFYLSVFLSLLFMIFTLTVWTIPLFLCISWFGKHGKLMSDDKEYAQAKNDIKKTTLLWTSAHSFNAILLLDKFYK